MIKKLQILLGVCLFFGTAPVFAQGGASNDIDADGMSDFFTTKTTPASKLRWTAKKSSDSTDDKIGLLGKKGDLAAVVDWQGLPAITRLSKSASGSTAIWSAKTALTGNVLGSFNLGKPTDTLVVGADFDGDLVPDGVAVRTVGTKLRWFIKHSPLAGGTTEDQIDFGSKGDKPTYMDLEGDGDWLAVAGKKTLNPTQYKLRLKNPRTNDTDTINLGTFSGTPEPIADTTGRDVLALVTRTANKTQVTFRNRFGAIIDSVEFNHPNNSKDGRHIIGDFIDSDPGEEIAVQVGTDMKVYNPFSETTTTVADVRGMPVNGFVAAAIDTNNCGTFALPDGGNGSIWKPNSDTQYFAVFVASSAYTGKIASVSVYTASNNTKIKDLTYKGVGNPDPNGIDRENYQDYTMTGAMYKSQYGSIKLRLNLKSGSCLEAVLNDPSVRID